MFQKINLLEIQRKLGIRDKAMAQAINNKPAKEETELDGAQVGIVDHMKRILASEKEMVTQELSRLFARIKEAKKQFEFLAGQVEAVKDRLMKEIESAQSLWAGKIDSLEKKTQEKEIKLEGFKTDHGLIRDADYPESQIFQWAVIIALLVTESILNSYFFAKGSDMGLLGGFFQAFLISMANIGPAILVGLYVLPFKEGKIEIVKAVFTTVAYIAYVIFFNLAVAHYRAQLGINPLDAMTKAIPSLISSPLGIKDFEAWILFLLGMMASFLVIVKSRFSDDPYPGYGKVDRAYRFAEKEIKWEEGKMINEINSLIDQNIKEIRNFESEISLQESIHGSSCKELIRSFGARAEEIESACNELLSIYRKHNQEVRTDAPPAYFSETLSSEDDKKITDLGILKKIEDEAVEEETLSSKLKEINKNINAFEEKMNALCM